MDEFVEIRIVIPAGNPYHKEVGVASLIDLFSREGISVASIEEYNEDGSPVK